MRLPIALVVLMIVTPAIADDAAIKLVKAWWKANEQCRVSSAPPVSKPACDARAEPDRKLADNHLCFGQLRNFPAERAWHPCGRPSSGFMRQALSGAR